MRKIKIDFVDFFSGFDKYSNEFIDILSLKYDVEISNDPEYIFYSCFGLEHLKYSCVRIFYTGECITPNFNECDYAIGFDRMSFGDRYIRVPLYQLFQYKKTFYELFEPRNFTETDLKNKNRFCNFIYSNCFAQDQRTKIFEKLCEYKNVDSAGRYRNNIGAPVKDKRKFQEECKFSIAFENTSYDGYVTEKLMEAFAAKTIPIYFGDPNIALDFNEEAFINCHLYDSFDDILDQIKKIDKDDNLYLEMINKNPLKKESFKESLLKDFLYHIFDQDTKDAFRRPFSAHSKDDESILLRHRLFEKYIYSNYKKVKNQIVRIKRNTIIFSKRK